MEIISESSTAQAIDRKIADYLAFGALEVWVMYPKQRHIWMYETGGRAELRAGRFALTLMPGIELDLEEILSV